jgi:hypothetical protein
MPRRAIAAAVIVVAALLAAGCGGSSDDSSSASPTSEWAGGLCSAITSWTSSLSSIGDTLKQGSFTKDSLTSAVDDAKSATDTFTSDLDGLGLPDTDAGEQAKDSVDQLSTDLKADMTVIEDAVDGASGVSGILDAVSVVSSTLVKMGSKVSSTITSFQDLDAKGELESAFKQADSCTELAG